MNDQCIDDVLCALEMACKESFEMPQNSSFFAEANADADAVRKGAPTGRVAILAGYPYQLTARVLEEAVIRGRVLAYQPSESVVVRWWKYGLLTALKNGAMTTGGRQA